MFKKASKNKWKAGDPEIAAWERGPVADTMARPLVRLFPRPEENVKDAKFFAVKDYEKALFYNKGALVGEIGGGIYEIEQGSRVKGTEIAWVDTSLVEVPWGIPRKHGIPAKEGCLVGLHGDLKLRVGNATAFYTNVVAGRKELTVEDIREWILTLLQTSLRDIFKKHAVGCIIMEDRETVIDEVTAKVTEEFLKYGLDLESFNIIGLKYDEGLDEIAGSGVKRRKVLHDRIAGLEARLQALQDQLLDDKITQAEFDEKREQLDAFLAEAREDLRVLDA